MPKPGVDFTDLIPVTTATGQPVSPAESANDVLGSIVREHLQRAASTKPERKEEKPEASVDAQVATDLLLAQISEVTSCLDTPVAETAAAVEANPLEGAVGGAEKSDLLAPASDATTVQKEFDALFAGAAGPEQVGSESGRGPVDPDASQLSSQEIDALLEEQGKSPADGAAAEPEATGADSAERAMAEAEGVLQEELAQLMAAPVMTPPPAQPAAPSEPTAAAAAPLAVPTPVPTPVVDPATMPPVVIIEAPETAPEPEAPPQRRWRILSDVGLMAGQLLDLPFAWISEAEKNLIGVAAFMLLLGGAVLWILCWMM